MTRPRLRIKTGDEVLIIAGKDRGKRGPVERVLPDDNKVVVEGINMAKKHMRANQQVMQGGIVDQEMPIHISNVQLICPECEEPTRVGKRRLRTGRQVRVCKACGEMVDD